MTNRNSHKLFRIEEGIVIDHIPSPKGLTVFHALSKTPDGIVSIGLNFSSESVGTKDIIKYENIILDKKETDKIALIAPEATINIIKNSVVVEKRKIDVPKEINGLLKCQNPNCITNIEKLETSFKVVENKEVKVLCKYCERITEIKSDMIIKG